MGVAQLHEPSAFVGAVGVDRAAEMPGIVGDDPDRSPFDAGEARHDRLAETRSQFECRVDVSQCRDRVANLVDPLSVLGHDVAHRGAPLRAQARRRAALRDERDGVGERIVNTIISSITESEAGFFLGKSPLNLSWKLSKKSSPPWLFPEPLYDDLDFSLAFLPQGLSSPLFEDHDILIKPLKLLILYKNCFDYAKKYFRYYNN